VTLERIEAEEQGPVEPCLQCCQRSPERRLGRATRMLVEPKNAIATNVAALDARRTPPDARRMKFAGGVSPARLGAKRGNRLLRQERGFDRPPALFDRRANLEVDRMRHREGTAAKTPSYNAGFAPCHPRAALFSSEDTEFRCAS